MKTRSMYLSVVSAVAVFLVAAAFNSAPAAGPSPEVLERNIADLQKKVTDLEKRLAAMESVIKVSGSYVTITTSGDTVVRAQEFVVQASRISLKASGELELKGARITQN